VRGTIRAREKRGGKDSEKKMPRTPERGMKVLSPILLLGETRRKNNKREREKMEKGTEGVVGQKNSPKTSKGKPEQKRKARVTSDKDTARGDGRVTKYGPLEGKKKGTAGGKENQNRAAREGSRVEPSAWNQEEKSVAGW